MYMSVRFVPRFRQNVGALVSRLELSGSGQDQSQGSQRGVLVKTEEVMNKTLRGRGSRFQGDNIQDGKSKDLLKACEMEMKDPGKLCRHQKARQKKGMRI